MAIIRAFFAKYPLLRRACVAMGVASLLPALVLAQAIQHPVLANSAQETLSVQIAGMNDELAASAASPLPNPVRAGQLLNQRAKLLVALIESDPAKALAAGLPADASSRLRTIAPQAELELQGDWQGVLEWIV